MFGIIPVHIRRNETISDKAKLLYCEITDCLGDDLECTKSNFELSNYLSVSEASLKRYLYELKSLDLIEVEGKTKDRIIRLPQKNVIVVGNEREKRTKRSKRPDKEELTREIVDIWNTEVVTGGKGIRVTPKLIRTVSARCVNFKDDEVIEAVNNRAQFVRNSKWHNEQENHKHRNDIYLVLRGDTELEKHYLMDISKSNGNGNKLNITSF